MCCFGEDNGYTGCLICFVSRQTDYPFRYLTREQVGWWREKAGEELSDVIETNPRCQFKKDKLCDVHRGMHVRWQRETGRTSVEWPGSFVGVEEGRRREIVGGNREWVEKMKGMKGIERKY